MFYTTETALSQQFLSATLSEVVALAAYLLHFSWENNRLQAKSSTIYDNNLQATFKLLRQWMMMANTGKIKFPLQNFHYFQN